MSLIIYICKSMRVIPCADFILWASKNRIKKYLRNRSLLIRVCQGSYEINLGSHWAHSNCNHASVIIFDTDLLGALLFIEIKLIATLCRFNSEWFSPPLSILSWPNSVWVKSQGSNLCLGFSSIYHKTYKTRILMINNQSTWKPLYILFKVRCI